MKETLSICTGTFDGELHEGHVYFLNEVKHYGDKSIAFINPNSIIRRHKNREPIYLQDKRTINVRALGLVSEVRPCLEENDDENLRQIMQVHPTVVCFTEKNNSSFDIRLQRNLAPLGTRFVTIHAIDPVRLSTSAIYSLTSNRS